MKIAFACDPLSGFNLKKDSTYAMMREAFKRGHELYAFQHADIMIHEGRVSATASHIVLTGDTGAWYRVEQTEQQSLSLFDVVVERTDPPFDMEYVYATHLLELAVTQGARVWNHPAAIRNHNEKLAITGFTQFTAPTLVSCDPSHVRAFHAEHHGAVVPYCLARVPQAGEVRGNLAAGGTGIAMPLSEREREIAETLAPVLRARGLMLVGLDIIGQYLTEINVTSPTCFQEIMQQTACDVAALFVDALERATH